MSSNNLTRVPSSLFAQDLPRLLDEKSESSLKGYSNKGYNAAYSVLCLYPNDIDARISLGLIHLEVGHKVEALEFANQVLERSPEHALISRN